MITVYRVEFNGSSYLDNNLLDVKQFVDSLDPEDKVVITECEIDEATFWALDEFSGF